MFLLFQLLTTMKRADCNNYNHFDSIKCDEHLKKYSNSWCSCDRNSRDGFKHETTEICRMKIREFKSLATRKCSFNQEYENMDLEYDISRSHKLEKEGRYECCRIRANLCELPTTYVSNNHQISNVIDNSKMSKETSDYVDLKNVTYEHSLKFVDFNDQLENLESMLDKSKNEHLAKINPMKREYLRNGRKNEERNFKNGFTNKNFSKIYQEQVNSNQNNVFKESCGAIKNSSIDLKNNCKGCCPLVDFKYHNLSDHKYVCFDTSTYFDKRNDMPNLHYTSEVGFLREKLKTLQNNTYSSYVNCTTKKDLTKDDTISSLIEQDDLNSSDIIDIYVSTMNIKPKLKKERQILSPPLVKGRYRVSLKTRSRVNSAKLKKIKSKQAVANRINSER